MLIPIRVECYAGFRANQEPRAVDFGEGPKEVVEIVDRWYEAGRLPEAPAADYFKLWLADARTVLVKRDWVLGAWFLVREWPASERRSDTPEGRG